MGKKKKKFMYEKSAYEEIIEDMEEEKRLKKIRKKQSKIKTIPITKFVSEKVIKKLRRVIDTNLTNIMDAYDKIEEIMLDTGDFETKSIGTNRLVFISKKEKYKKYIFKVAGDSHGLEANLKEYKMQWIDPKRMVKTYSMSDNKVIIVQERVYPFMHYKEYMEKYVDGVKDMLKHLEKKILLVDCQISNFKNFGKRDNGDIVLLDYGDTVPLPKCQTDEYLNANEEFEVSLRCKKINYGPNGKEHVCGGKLKYDEGYGHFICKKCNRLMRIAEAYRPAYCDMNVERILKGYKGTNDPMSFDLGDWAEYSKRFNVLTTDNNEAFNANDKGELQMTNIEQNTKTINGKACSQIKGYWIPNEFLEKPALSLKVVLVKKGTIKPSDFLKDLNLNPNDYKVYINDHTPNKDKRAPINTDRIDAIVDSIEKCINESLNDEGDSIYIPFSKIEFDDYKINQFTVRPIFKRMIQIPNIGHIVTKANGFEISKTPFVSANKDDTQDKEIDNTDNIEYVIFEGSESEIKCAVIEGSKYYIPEECVNDCMVNGKLKDKSEIKEILKKAGYKPKTLKIDQDENTTDTNAENYSNELIDDIKDEFDISDSDNMLIEEPTDVDDLNDTSEGAHDIEYYVGELKNSEFIKEFENSTKDDYKNYICNSIGEADFKVNLELVTNIMAKFIDISSLSRSDIVNIFTRMFDNVTIYSTPHVQDINDSTYKDSMFYIAFENYERMYMDDDVRDLIYWSKNINADPEYIEDIIMKLDDDEDVLSLFIGSLKLLSSHSDDNKSILKEVHSAVYDSIKTSIESIDTIYCKHLVTSKIMLYVDKIYKVVLKDFVLYKTYSYILSNKDYLKDELDDEYSGLYESLDEYIKNTAKIDIRHSSSKKRQDEQTDNQITLTNYDDAIDTKIVEDPTPPLDVNKNTENNSLESVLDNYFSRKYNEIIKILSDIDEKLFIISSKLDTIINTNRKE